jgi:hypothetical protein
MKLTKEANDQMVSLVMTKTMKRELLGLAELRGVSLSDVIRMALLKFIESEKVAV